MNKYMKKYVSDKFKKVYDNLEEIKKDCNENLKSFTLKSIFVGYQDETLCYKHVIQNNNLLVTMYINTDNYLIITENYETDEYN